ncbi:hypothetical protein QTP86_001345 [Hemibagrus guttatus]|nr:hypothetical protein QTP86_001345 [Hemibagrus guttatus]
MKHKLTNKSKTEQMYTIKILSMHPGCVIQLEKEKCMERMALDDPGSDPEYELGCGGSSLSRDAQTFLSLDTYSSSSGRIPRRSQVSQET